MRKPQVGDRVRITGFNLNLYNSTHEVVENHEENIKKYAGQEGVISGIDTIHDVFFPYTIVLDIVQEDGFDLWHESEFEVINDKAPSKILVDIILVYRVLTNRVNYFK